MARKSNYCPACGRSVNEGTVSSLGPDHEGMIERAARALCDFDNAQDASYSEQMGRAPTPLTYDDWRDEYDAKARAAVVAALGKER